jgi:hypothetical protein
VLLKISAYDESFLGWREGRDTGREGGRERERERENKENIQLSLATRPLAQFHSQV